MPFDIIPEKTLKLQDLNYDLPPELIADNPPPRREDARLLVISRANRTIKDETFTNLHQYLQPGDCLIFNNSRVFKARMIGQKNTGGKVEILLVEKLNANSWKALVNRSRRYPPGMKVTFRSSNKKQILSAELQEVTADGLRKIEFDSEIDMKQLEEFGTTPLPPYIVRRRRQMNRPLYNPEDEQRYQTIFAKHYGSVAAPTASLHFSPDFIDKIKANGINIGFVTLHIGLGTFRQIDTEIGNYRIHREWIEIPENTLDLIRQTRANGGRVIAVGTTVTRTLESLSLVYSNPDSWRAYSGYTDLFIKPPYKFKVIDGLITNFHLPRSSLLCLVYAFAGKEIIRKAYAHAIEQKYRFYSYGDATFII